MLHTELKCGNETALSVLLLLLCFLLCLKLLVCHTEITKAGFDKGIGFSCEEKSDNTYYNTNKCGD